MQLMSLVITVFGLLWSITSQAQPISLAAKLGAHPMLPKAEIYVDENHELTVEQIHGSGSFLTFKEESLNYGFTKARVWLRFQIQNDLPTSQERIMYLRYFLLDEVTLYSLEKNNFKAHYSGRLHLSEHINSLLPTRFFHFKLQIPANTKKTYYLALTSADAISTPIEMATLDQFQRMLIKDTVAITLFFGLILANLCFAVFMLIKLREIQLVYYIGFLVFHHLLTLMMLEGVHANVLNIENLFWNRTGIIFTVNIAVVMSVLFLQSFLQLKNKYPSHYSLSRILFVITLVSTIQCLLVPHTIGSALSVLLCMSVGVGIMYVCIKCALEKDRSARLFLLSWSAGITGATIYGLRMWEILPVNEFTINAWKTGATLEAILFSFTIADRVTTERRMRQKTQTELVKQERLLRKTQEQLLKSETAAKEELEKMVHERTQDITRILAELENQNRQLTELSINDGLTKVRNRRFFNDAYPQIWKEALEQDKWISIILLDIDHFKSINDTYGHLVGDHCLISVATCLRNKITRPRDIICRFGGEEFILVLFDTDEASALHLAENLRATISEVKQDIDGSSITLTASFGVASYNSSTHIKPMDAVGQCDEALYQAKTGGRNQVVIANQVKQNPISRKN